MSDIGYIKLFRSILDSRVFANEKAFKIWMWCLLKASHKKEFIPMPTGRGDIIVEVNPGQFIFGKKKAAKELRMKPTTVYDWMKRLSSSDFNMIVQNPEPHYTIVTICNWEQYQLEDNITRPATDQLPTSYRPTTDTYKNNKNIKEKNIKKRKGPDEELLDNINAIPEGFFEPFLTWLQYKRKKGQSYKDEVSAGLALKKLYNFSEGDPKTAMEIVEQSMSNNYSGLFKLKNTFNKNERNNTSISQVVTSKASRKTTIPD